MHIVSSSVFSLELFQTNLLSLTGFDASLKVRNWGGGEDERKRMGLSLHLVTDWCELLEIDNLLPR